MSARRVYAVILSNPSRSSREQHQPTSRRDSKGTKDNTMKHRKHSRRPSRSNPDMGAMRRTAGVAAKIALGAVAGAAGAYGLASVDMSPKKLTAAIAAGGAIVGGGLMLTGRAPNVGAGFLASAATVVAQRAYALHGVGAYIDSMRSPAQRAPGSLPAPSGYVVSQYMPGGFVVAEPGMGRAVNR